SSAIAKAEIYTERTGWIEIKDLNRVKSGFAMTTIDNPTGQSSYTFNNKD
ncbi:hypothetical protein RDWZM_006196, partial [Blomia tropicalis]